jgi:hypothetical protein
MTSVPDIAANVSKVHEQDRSSVAHSLVELADLEGDDGFDTRTESEESPVVRGS